MTHKCNQNYFQTHDNSQLFYQHWKPQKKSNKAIVMFHRGHEHSERVKHLVEELGLEDYHFFAWDARGHGKSPGERGYAPNVACVVQDIDCFIKHINTEYKIPTKNMITLGQSVGAVTLSTWLHDYAPKVKAAILASPAFKVKLYVPLAIPGLKTLKFLAKKEHFVNSYVKGNLLSHDPLRIEEYNTDKSITRPISVSMLTDLFDTAQRVVEDAYAIEHPILMLVSGNDFVVEKEPQYEFFAKLPSEHKEIFELPDFYHDTLGEKNRELAMEHIRKFIRKIEATEITPRDLTVKNPYHFSYIELEKLSRQGHPLEEKFFQIQSDFLKIGSKISDALKVGEETGYDSGSMLDVVYKNQSSSKNPLGKLIDRVYLDAIGWKGIRIRKENIEKACKLIVELQNQKGIKQVGFADIAAGHGRYDIDFLQTLDKSTFFAELSDYSELNVKQGSELIAERGLSDNIKFKQGDAFNTEYVKNLATGKNLVVVSGLYELYPDNDLISASLLGISQGIDVGGYLVYTNQPWHPQLKFIAKVLTSHRGKDSWVMRRRSQNEMDQLVEKQGFEKIQQYIDPYGIFTVSVAIKNKK